jgi:hypothetical protein
VPPLWALHSIAQLLHASLAMRRAKGAMQQAMLAADVERHLEHQPGSTNGRGPQPRLEAGGVPASMPPVDERALQARILESLVGANADRPARNAIFKLHSRIAEGCLGAGELGPAAAAAQSATVDCLAHASQAVAQGAAWPPSGRPTPLSGGAPDPLRSMELARRAWER